MKYERHIDLKAVGPVWAKTADFGRRLDMTRRIVQKALARCENPYVSLSGGKDSVAMLGVVAEVAHQIRRPVTAWVHLSDASFPGTEDICVQTCQQCGVPLVIDRSSVSAFEIVGQGSREKFGKKGVFFEAVERASQGHDLVFVGVRAAESKRRRDAAQAHGTFFHTTVAGDIQKCHPLLWWSIEDVAAALAVYKLPIHPIYFKRPLQDLPIRLGYATSLDLLDKGGAVFLRTNYPELFTRFCQAFPPARNYL